MNTTFAFVFSLTIILEQNYAYPYTVKFTQFFCRITRLSKVVLLFAFTSRKTRSCKMPEYIQTCLLIVLYDLEILNPL